MLRIDRQRGVSLVELMVSLTIGLFVILGVTQVFTAAVRANTDAVQFTNLNEQLRAVSNAMSREIRRSGYFAQAAQAAGSGTFNNPFWPDLHVADRNGDGDFDCLLYAYDEDGGGDADADELRGFRLEGNEIQVLTANATANRTTAGDCAAATWQSFTDDSVVQITNLAFDFDEDQVIVDCEYDAAANTHEILRTFVRTVDITVEGRLTSDNQVTRRVDTLVRVRNDRLTDQTGVAGACP